MNRTLAATGLLAAAALALAGCAGQQASGGKPELGIATSPHAVAPGPPAQLASACPVTLPGNYPFPQASAVSMVAGTPNAATVCRYAGLNDPKPHQLAKSVQASATQAAQLAHQLDLSKPMPAGVAYNCPNDTGRSALIVFGFADGHHTAVQLNTSGCRTATNGHHKVFFSNGVNSAVTALVGQP
jgi:hypothetical protein